MKKLDFKNWYSNILEAVNTKEPVAVATDEEEAAVGTKGPETDSSSPSFSREEIISDIDTIMTHLSQLGTQVREELDNEHILDVNEAGTGTDAMAAVKDFLFAPKYRSMQKKVNAMKINALDIKIHADELSGAKDTPEGKTKDALLNKKTLIDGEVSKLQADIDKKAQERGEYVKSVLSSEKIKGQMAIVKKALGEEEDPAKQKSLKDQATALTQKYQKEAEDQAKAKQKIEDEKAKAAAAKTPATKGEKTPATKGEKTTATKKKSEDTTEETTTKGTKSTKESLVIDAIALGLNEMAAEIESKLEWQFENNSVLARKYEAEIAKAKANKSLNESRYNNISVADKFRQLLG